MKKISILFIPMFFLAGCQTIPQGWVLTGQSRPDQTPSWIMAADPSSIRVDGQTATMTSMMSYSSPKATDRYKNGYLIELASNEYKCGERLSRILKVDLYESKEVIVGSIKTPTKYEAIRPSTIGEAEYNLACAGVRAAPAWPPAQAAPPPPSEVRSVNDLINYKNSGTVFGSCHGIMMGTMGRRDLAYPGMSIMDFAKKFSKLGDIVPRDQMLERNAMYQKTINSSFSAPAPIVNKAIQACLKLIN